MTYKHLPNSGSFKKGHKGYKGMLGKHHSEESRKNMSEAQKGRILSEEEKNRLRKMSLENAKAYKAKRIKTVCANCGKELELPKSTYNENGNFCSKKCNAVFHREATRERRKGTKASEATKEKLRRYKGEKHSQWKGGKPKCKICGKEIQYESTYCDKCKVLFWTKEHREKIRIGTSNTLRGRIPKNLNYPITNKFRPFGNVKRGYYDINRESIFFRSKWEANYALYLDFLIKQKQIKRWEYEKDVFVFDKIKFGTKSYRPDFKVYNNDKDFEYHEVKGYMDAQSKTKIKRMAKYYPDIKLIIIDKDVYMDIKKKLGEMLKFY